MFKPGDTERMAALEKELTRVLLRANQQKLEAAVAAFACIRCARALLDQYPSETHGALLQVVIAFLRHDDVTVAGDAGGKLLVM